MDQTVPVLLSLELRGLWRDKEGLTIDCVTENWLLGVFTRNLTVDIRKAATALRKHPQSPRVQIDSPTCL